MDRCFEPNIILLKPFNGELCRWITKSWRNINVPTVHPVHGTETGYANTVGDEKQDTSTIPTGRATRGYLEEDRDRLYGNVGVKIAPASWLTVTGRINGDIYQYNAQDRIAVYSRSQSQYSNIFRNTMSLTTN